MVSAVPLSFLALSFLVAALFAPNTEAIFAKRSTEHNSANEAAVGEMPWLALLEFPQNAVCSGTVISPTAVLSAAVCLGDTKNPANGTAYAGNVKYTQPEDFQPPTEKRDIVSYHLYDKDNPLIYNIMLVKVAPRWRWTRNVQPIAIVDHHKIPTYFTPLCTISGFGYGSNSREDSRVARSADMWMAGWRACLSSPQEHRLCTFDQDSRAPCVGDLGGSVLCDGAPGGDLLYGIISEYGHSGLEENPDKCKLPARASGFQFVGFYVPWIKSIAGDLPTNDEVKGIKQQVDSEAAVSTQEMEHTMAPTEVTTVQATQNVVRRKRDDAAAPSDAPAASTAAAADGGAAGGDGAGGAESTTPHANGAECVALWRWPLLAVLAVGFGVVSH